MHNETRLCPPGWSRHSISDPSQLGGPFRDSNLPDAYKPRFIYKHDSVLDREFLYPLPIEERRQDSSPAMIFAPYITCRTKKAGLFVHEFIVGVCDRRFLHVALRDQQGSWAGSLQTNEGLDTLPPECVIHVPNHWAWQSPGSDETDAFQGVSTPPSPKPLELVDSPKPLDLVEISTGYCPLRHDTLDTMPPPPLGTPMSKCEEAQLKVKWDINEFYNVLWVEWVDGVAYRKGVGKVWKGAWESLEREDIDLVLG